MFYFDPPYYGAAGYGIEFGLPEYQHMAELARTIEGRMVVSVNDCPQMREVYNGLTMKSVPITYTVGGKQGRTPRRADYYELVMGVLSGFEGVLKGI